MEINTDGFFQPVISNNNKCVECGRCLNVCPLNSKDKEKGKRENSYNGYASWSRDLSVRHKSSSGGTGFEVARYLLNKGYKIIGVRYNAVKERAEHYVATRESELIPSMGSKYIQSYTDDAFPIIKKGEKYLITGTPCQIAGLRRFVRSRCMENDVILMDFFCHGVPSLNMWHKYTAEAEQIVGKITYASWRNKNSGWHDSWVMDIDGVETGDCLVDINESYEMIMGEKKPYITKKRSDGDIFYKFFLGDMCFNRSCYKNCRFKMLESDADIRIGDLWGTKYAENDLGVTGVISFTTLGKEVLFHSNIELIPETIDVVTEGQMSENPKLPYYYNLLMRLFHTSLKLKTIYRIVQLMRFGSILKYKLHLI